MSKFLNLYGNQYKQSYRIKPYGVKNLHKGNSAFFIDFQAIYDPLHLA